MCGSILRGSYGIMKWNLGYFGFVRCCDDQGQCEAGTTSEKALCM